MRKIFLPLTKGIVKTLKQGEMVLLNGPVLTARDAAHKRLWDALKKDKKIPQPIMKRQAAGKCTESKSHQ